MAESRRSRAPGIAGIVLVVAAFLGFGATGLGMLPVQHNALYSCDESTRPPGALPFEGGYAGTSFAGSRWSVSRASGTPRAAESSCHCYPTGR